MLKIIIILLTIITPLFLILIMLQHKNKIDIKKLRKINAKISKNKTTYLIFKCIMIYYFIVYTSIIIIYILFIYAMSL